MLTRLPRPIETTLRCFRRTCSSLPLAPHWRRSTPLGAGASATPSTSLRQPNARSPEADDEQIVRADQRVRGSIVPENMTGVATVNLLSRLEKFNRKERFFLVGWALANPQFVLGEEFRADLRRELKLDVDIPADAFVAMDYHLDWLHASLFLAAHPGSRGPQHNQDAYITATQEDIDLLIAFEAGNATHVLLIEAKGATGWTNKQVAHKVGRLGPIFTQAIADGLAVEPRLAIASPKNPIGIKCKDWPRWMLRDGKPWWVKMPFTEGQWAVTRCDVFGGRSRTGAYWSVLERTRRNIQARPRAAAGATPDQVLMGATFSSVQQIVIGQPVTFKSTVGQGIQVGTVRQVNATTDKVLVARQSGSAAWMNLGTIGNLRLPLAG
jgi:hypothetical protein